MTGHPKRSVACLPLIFAIAFVFSGASPSGAAPAAPAEKREPPAEPLAETVAHLDAQLFDAYNRCDLETFGAMLAEDLEFYHDHSGLSVGRQDTVDAVRENICGKTRRELVPGSLEVYGLADWGAVEIGVHRFFPVGDKDAPPFGEAKFIHLWRRVGEGWQLARVVSFDHGALKEE